jgi:hypothetical protein
VENAIGPEVRVAAASGSSLPPDAWTSKATMRDPAAIEVTVTSDGLTVDPSLAAISASKLALNDAFTVGLFRIAEAAAAGIGSVSDAATLVALSDAA